MDKTNITGKDLARKGGQEPLTWAERHAALMARIEANRGHSKRAEHGPHFGHGLTRYNLPRCTTKRGKAA
jgi:hypothetical protein